MKMSVKIRAPKGFHFQIRKYFYRGETYGNVMVNLMLSKTGKKIGHINLVKEGSKWLETHSHLDSDYHNKGLGVLMYSKAIHWALKNGWKVRSGGPSEAAQRVWRGNSIRKLFNIRIKKYARDPQPNYDTFFAYAK